MSADREAKCRDCGCTYVPAPRALARFDYKCRACRSRREREWYAQRKADGRPVVKRSRTGKARGAAPKHGHTVGRKRSRAYRCWEAMKRRCDVPTERSYRNYGARGITYCPEWSSFENFYRDMGDPPEGMSIDRINNDLGYSKDNCRWASAVTQVQNRRVAVRHTFDGITLNLSEWARRLRVKPHTITLRLRAGWSLGQALTVPSRNTQQRRQS